ncbi:MAG: hypothetical protein RBR87_03235 [Bacteroidales bacterium]|jgi:hypothetical protein|nr:hypothetical protein [Bacteroidales bacterium]
MSKYRIYFIFIGILSILIGIPPALFSQVRPQWENQTDPHYSKFKSRFEKKMSLQDIADLEPPPSNISHVFLQTELPQWVFNLPSSNQNVIFTLGISDPGMTADSARLLAILRAKAILAIMNHSKVSGLTDYYISEKDLKSGEVLSSVYQEFNKIISDFTFNVTGFTIEKEAFTNHGEHIILASLNTAPQTSNDSVTIKSLAEVSVSYIKRNNKHSTTSRTELMGDEKEKSKNLNNSFYYLVKHSNKQIKILSNFNEREVTNFGEIMTYKTPTNQVSINDPSRLSCTLQHGLWHAFSYLILKKVVLDFQDSNIYISSLSDNYTQIKQNINRVLNQKEVSFKMLGLAIKNNLLYLDLE